MYNADDSNNDDDDGTNNINNNKDDNNNNNNNSVVVCTDLWSNELLRQVGVGKVLILGSLCGVMPAAHWPGMPEMWFRVPLWARYFPFSSHPQQ